MPYPWNSGDTLTAGDLNAAIGTASGSGGAGSNNVGRNLIHNSMFNVAQRARGSIAATPVGTAVYMSDRWAGLCLAAGDSLSAGNVAHSDGNRAAIGDEAAQWFTSGGFAGGAGASNGVLFFQKIEDVSRVAGKTVTVSFWANAAPNMSIGVNVLQSFGSGGSPSTQTLAGAQARALTATWTRFTATFAVPSIAGKTLGTNGDHFTQLEFWYSAGTTNAIRSGIGVQSGTINIWGVQLEVGSVATPLEKLDPVMQLQQCQRFYCTGQVVIGGYGTAGMANVGQTYSLPMPLRSPTPTVTIGATSNTNIGTVTGTALSFAGTCPVIWFSAAVGGTAGGWMMNVSFTASADL
jgi:hypothetical protein